MMRFWFFLFVVVVASATGSTQAPGSTSGKQTSVIHPVAANLNGAERVDDEENSSDVKLNIFVCMKTIKFLLCVSIMIISGCGVRPESDSLYRWRRIHPAADSIVFALEDGFVNSVPDSLLWPLLQRIVLGHKSKQIANARTVVFICSRIA